MDVSTLTLRMLFERPLDIPVLQWALFLIISGFIVVMMYLQMRNDPLDLRWLILDRQHRPVFSKIAQIIALAVSTWAFVVFTLKGTLTETYFIAYMCTWSGSAALEAYISRDARRPRRRDDARDYEHGTPNYGGNPYDNERRNPGGDEQ